MDCFENAEEGTVVFDPDADATQQLNAWGLKPRLFGQSSGNYRQPIALRPDRAFLGHTQ